MPEEKLSRLTAHEFYAKWSDGTAPYTGSPATIERRTVEFAEAYAQHRLQEVYKPEWSMGIMKPKQCCVQYADWFCDKQKSLLRRAAELLRQAGTGGYLGRKFWEDINQWLRDAGL